jgi:hypothetical protein
MTVSKFYHYTLWVEEDDGTRVNPQEVLSDDVFHEDMYDITESDDKYYSTQFHFIRNWEHHGVLIRTKDDTGYVRQWADGSITSLSEATNDDGKTADLNFDYVDYAICVGLTSIDLLVRVGFQTPGIGMIKRYLNDHIEHDDEYDLVHESKLTTESEQRLEQVLDASLKKIEISLKKHPRNFEELDLEESLENLVPDDYRLEFGVTLQRGKNQRKRSARSVLSRVFGRDEKEVENTIAQIDLPRIMYSFNIVGFEEGDEDTEIEEDLADAVLKEQIDTVPYDLFDPELGEVLCRRIRELDQ